MDIKRTLPIAERVNTIRETWQVLIVRPDLDLSDEQLSNLASKLDAAIQELWRALGAPIKEYEVSLFERCVEYLDIPEMPESCNHSPICDRCKSIAKVREVMPDTYLCIQCEALLDQEMPLDGVDFTPVRPAQEGDLPF